MDIILLTQRSSEHRRLNEEQNQLSNQKCMLLDNTRRHHIVRGVTPDDVKHSWISINIPRTLHNIQMISAHGGIKVSYSSIAANTLGKTTMVHIEPINLIDCMEQYRVIDMTKLYWVNRTDKGLGVSMKRITVCWMLISWVRLLVSTRNGVVLSWH